jgi:hypothetical protein
MIGINSTLPMASLQQCLTIDSGYQNCFQHLARAYPIKGDVETALKLCNETLEHMLHSTSDGLVSTTFRGYDEMAADPGQTAYSLWHPDGDEFRTTPQFKSVVRQLGIYEYWQARGYPPHCKPVGDDDFECGRPD